MLNIQLQNKDLIIKLTLSIYIQHTYINFKQILKFTNFNFSNNLFIFMLFLCTVFIILIFYCNLFLYNYLFDIAPL